MADETQVTETAPAPVEEEKKGRGASGFIGGVAGGAGAFIGIDNYVANKGIKKVINPEAVKDAAKDAAKEAKEPVFKSMVDKVLEGKTDKAKTAIKSLDNFKEAKGIDAKTIEKVTIGEAKDGVHNLTFHLEGGAEKNVTATAKELGKDLAGKKELTGDALKSFAEGEKAGIKSLVGKLESSATKSIRKADGLVAGIKNANWQGKLAIAAVTIAGVGVGSKVLHAIAGGKHTKKVEEQAQLPETGQARA